MECNKDYLRLIKEALEQRRLAFFIGAGVSKATNKNYPSWTKVTETLRKGLSECDETDPLKIAQLYALKFGNLKLKESVKSLFPIKDIPSDIQQAFSPSWILFLCLKSSLFMTIFPLNPPKHPSHADICLFFGGDGTAICLYRLAMLSQGHTSRQGIPISLCGTPSTWRV